MKIYCVKQAGVLVPSTEEDAEQLNKIAAGKVVSVEVKQTRNYQFHQKFFAALNLGFDAFDPQATHKGEPVQKSFDRFRKDVIILAGYYDNVANIKGEVRAEAHSISFGSMSQERFEEVYNAVVNVLLTRVLRNYTRSDFDKVIQELIKF